MTRIALAHVFLLIFLVALVADGSSVGASVQATPSVAHDQDSCIVELTGDVNQSGTITSSDIICLILYVFLDNGPCPLQPCPAVGDVNCTGTVTTSDIIYTVNYIFKSGTPPCDVCSIIPSKWNCPE